MEESCVGPGPPRRGAVKVVSGSESYLSMFSISSKCTVGVGATMVDGVDELSNLG